jgi:hypothetical protein
MKPLHLAFVILGLALVAAVVIFGGKAPLGGQVACTMEAKICPDGTAVGRQGPNCEFAPCPTGMNQEIRVTVPQSNDAVGLPLVMTGEAKVFEGVFGYRLLNADGKKLLEGFGQAQVSDAGSFGAFELAVNYPDPKTETGTLEFIEFDVESGLEAEKIVIPVRFAPVEAMEVNIYFNNSQKDPNSTSCETTYPTTRRIAKTPAVATEAVRELLRGLTSAEGALGFMTALNPGVELVSLTVEGGVAKADFNEALIDGVAGSCRVMAIRSQIENTLKQFPSVKSVVIAVDGNSEDILQP